MPTEGFNTFIANQPSAASLTGSELFALIQASKTRSITKNALIGTVINVIDYGADQTFTNDSSAAIQAADTAATAAGALLYFPSGIYAIGSNRVNRGGCSWQGDGPFSSIIKSQAVTYSTNNTQMVKTLSVNDFVTIDLGFDVSLATFEPGSGVPGNGYSALTINKCNNWKVQNCAFTGIQAHVYALGVDEVTTAFIENNYFDMPAPSSSPNQGINLSISAGVVTNVTIRNNILIGTGIYSDGTKILIDGNNVSGWAFGSGITCGPGSGDSNYTITNNICTGGIGEDVNNTYPSGIECWIPNSVIIGNQCNTNSGNGIQLGSTGTVCADNICYNNGQTNGSNGAGIVIESTSGLSQSNAIVTGNICFDNQGSPTQIYGIVEVLVGGSLAENIISGNNAFGNVTANYAYLGETPSPNLNYINGPLQIAGSLALPAGGSSNVVLLFGSQSGFGIYAGTGAPTFNAPVNSLYIRGDASTPITRLYSSLGSGTWAFFTASA
jgi:hypothetical protein